MQFNPDVAIQQFVERYQATEGKEQIDNSRLYAGSPMYYYCRHCREHTETLPECHMKRPKTCCDPCEALMTHGLIPKALKQAGEAVARGAETSQSNAWDRIGGA